jgi:hypothetical protein
VRDRSGISNGTTRPFRWATARRGDRGRCAPESVSAGSAAGALRQIFYVAGDFHGRGLADECDGVIGELGAGDEIAHRFSGAIHSNFTGQVALGADAVARFGGQGSGVHDVLRFSTGGMSRAGAVATFAAHSAFEERRNLVAVLSAVDGFDAGRVALQACGGDGSGQEWVGVSIVAR